VVVVVEDIFVVSAAGAIAAESAGAGAAAGAASIVVVVVDTESVFAASPLPLLQDAAKIPNVSARKLTFTNFMMFCF
jgi:hypothetical protein